MAYFIHFVKRNQGGWWELLLGFLRATLRGLGRRGNGGNGSGSMRNGGDGDVEAQRLRRESVEGDGGGG